MNGIPPLISRRDSRPNRDHTNIQPNVMNTFHWPNTTNLHLHGMHVSPNAPQDDVLTPVQPGESLTYTYSILKNHNPGINWYAAASLCCSRMLTSRETLQRGRCGISLNKKSLAERSSSANALHRAAYFTLPRKALQQLIPSPTRQDPPAYPRLRYGSAEWRFVDLSRACFLPSALALQRLRLHLLSPSPRIPHRIVCPLPAHSQVLLRAWDKEGGRGGGGGEEKKNN